MIVRRLKSFRTYIISIITTILLILSGCSTNPSQQAAPPTMGFDLSKEETPPPNNICPNEKTLYNLWFLHIAILDLDFGGGETFFLEFSNDKPSFFQLWIDPSGLITDEDIDNTTEISYHGTANHPNDDDCPVQTFDGIREMRAEIIGFCDDEEGLVKLTIKEEWINPTLNSSCDGIVPPPPGMYSAPELDLVFDLNIYKPTDGVSIPPSMGFQAEYAYLLSLASSDLDQDDLELVPLVPKE